MQPLIRSLFHPQHHPLPRCPRCAIDPHRCWCSSFKRIFPLDCGNSKRPWRQNLSLPSGFTWSSANTELRFGHFVKHISPCNELHRWPWSSPIRIINVVCPRRRRPAKPSSKRYWKPKNSSKVLRSNETANASKWKWPERSFRFRNWRDSWTRKRLTSRSFLERLEPRMCQSFKRLFE